MTTPTRAQKRADLARAMGYRIEAQLFQGHIPYFELLSPQGDERVEPYEDESGINDLAATEEEAWEYAPDPFTDAEANRKLLEWLLGEDSDAKFNEIVFLPELMKNYSYLWQAGKVDFNAGEVRAIIFRALTAPLDVKAEAAWLAIQEEPK